MLNATAAATLMRQAHPDAELRERAQRAEQAARALETRYARTAGCTTALKRSTRMSWTRRPPGCSRCRCATFAARASTWTRDHDASCASWASGRRRLAQQFERNLNSDVRAVALRPDQLDGLPDDYVAAHPPRADGSVEITTEYPDALPFLAFAHDADARRLVATAFNSRGWPDNDAVLRELFELAPDAPGCSGTDGWADYDASVKMIGSGAAIPEFMARLSDLAAAPWPTREIAELTERMRRDHPAPGAS